MDGDFLSLQLGTENIWDVIYIMGCILAKVFKHLP